MTLPRTPRGIWAELSRKYFGRKLPKRVTFRWVEDLSLGERIDTRDEMAAIWPDDTEEGVFHCELNRNLEGFTRLLYLVLAHEALHAMYPQEDHGSKIWNAEVRRLQGQGLLLRVF